MIELSVVLPAYNPPPEHLEPTLDALRAQTLPRAQWELVIVDNRSRTPVAEGTAAWHPHARVVREEAPGLVAARTTGFRNSTGGVIIVVDQDNVLAPDYLERALRHAQTKPWLGAWGAGIITPRYERPELAPPASLHPLLTLRAAASDRWSNDIGQHDSTPWGAGLCLRRAVVERHAEAMRENPLHQALDLSGDKRLAGGDTDLCYTACRMGLGKGVFIDLRMEHIIPAVRCTTESLEKTAEGRGYTEVLHHLVLHGCLPVRERGLRTGLRRLWRARGLSTLERTIQFAMERGREQAHHDLSPRG